MNKLWWIGLKLIQTRSTRTLYLVILVPLLLPLSMSIMATGEGINMEASNLITKFSVATAV